ncbi:SRSF protein kinase 2-like isoform X4 [Hemicordylus capensis]|uniref:SRSF protein kinase 2-like isoform X4 n=1 Tax=Hemicordylus capensis TaxID=884348 RepID=UPI00230388AD|nr:SRSF protein kinase 2-like isoform X4 [Hemicordylus capensis]
MEACEWQEEAPASCAEGYYPVRKGEMFSGRYHVVQNLGCGYFSTVWLCQDVGKKKCVAVKVPKGGEDFAEAALDEVMLLRYVNSKRRKDQAGDHVIRLLDDFKMIGENGFHVCLVFELLGPSLQVLLSSQGAQGLPPPFLKKAMQQVLKGLYFLHKECRIIHADIKPENILLHVTEASLQTLLHNMVSLDYSTGVEPKRPGGDMAALLDCCNLMKMGVKIADLGSACWTYKPFSKKIQTQPYRALEVLLGLDYSTPADIWSTACLVLSCGCPGFPPMTSITPSLINTAGQSTKQLPWPVFSCLCWNMHQKKGQQLKNAFSIPGSIPSNQLSLVLLVSAKTNCD